MSKRQETVMDVVAEMRSNEFDDPRFDRDGLRAARRLAKDWADRIEAAIKRGSTVMPGSTVPSRSST